MIPLPLELAAVAALVNGLRMPVVHTCRFARIGNRTEYVVHAVGRGLAPQVYTFGGGG